MDILLVHPDGDMRERLEDAIIDELTDLQPVVTTARHEAGALAQIEGRPFDVVVSHLALPRDSKAIKDEDNRRGLALAQQLSGQDHNPVVVLIAPPEAVADLISEINKLQRCNLVVDRGDFIPELVAVISSPLGRAEPATPAGALVGYVKIKISQKRQISRIETWTTGSADPDYFEREFNFPADYIDLMTEISNNLPSSHGENWLRDYRTVGKMVRNIIKREPAIIGPLQALITKVQGLKNIRIIFEIDRQAHALPFEALLRWWDTDASQDFVLLSTPVYRSITTTGSLEKVRARPNPFNGHRAKQEPFNCLVIDASLGGTVENLRNTDGQRLVLPEMSNGFEECRNIVKWLKKTKARQHAIDEIELITLRDLAAPANTAPEPAFWREMTRLMTEKHWHLVHFCGHSLFNEETGEAHIFVPTDPGNPFGGRAINILRFAKLLDRTDFVYLSSCQSSERGFVFDLASKQIPAILGFRWEVEDDKALEFATSFYHKLFEAPEPGSLESAFFVAQSRMHQNYPTDRHWGSPMLVVQNVTEAHH